MNYKVPIDLYKDWKDITYTKEVFENIVKELKGARKGGEA